MKTPSLVNRPVEFTASGKCRSVCRSEFVRNKIVETGFRQFQFEHVFTRPGNALSGITNCGDYLVATLDANTTAYKSVNGDTGTWSSLTIPGISSGVNSCKFTGNKAAMFGTASGIYTTDGGSTWLSSTYNGFSHPAGPGYRIPVSNGSIAVCSRYADGATNIAYTADQGVNWNLSNTIPNSYSASSNDFVWWDGNYFLLTRYGIDTLWYSSDGVTWSFTTITGLGALGVNFGASNYTQGFSNLYCYSGQVYRLNTNVTPFKFSLSEISVYPTYSYQQSYSGDLVTPLNIARNSNGIQRTFYDCRNSNHVKTYDLPDASNANYFTWNSTHLFFTTDNGKIYRAPFPDKRTQNIVTY